MAEDLGIIDAMRTLKWDSLGKRALALYSLYGLGIFSTRILTFLSIWQFTIRRICICLAVVFAWTDLFSTRTLVDDWRAQRQIAAIFPQFEQAGLALSDEWPAESGEIPPNIKFYVSPEEYADVLLIRGGSESYPFHENFGLMIT